MRRSRFRLTFSVGGALPASVRNPRARGGRGASPHGGASSRRLWTGGAERRSSHALCVDFAAGQRSKSTHKAWDERLSALPVDKRGEFARRINGDLPFG